MSVEVPDHPLEESVPWEVNLLREYCKSDVDLDSLGYAKKSVLAGAWFLCSQTSPSLDVCLRGEGRLEEGLVRQWIEFYLVRVRLETPWDALGKDQLQSVLEELDRHLSSRIYMISYKLSLADILLYYGLHKYLDAMSFGQKSQFTQVCRWFDQVQHSPGLRPFSFPLIVFHKNPLLLTSSSRQ